uniref:Uncharacterized protein n=1 Tax=Anguilla anguilla TaxID=7936 RepID=A0A0E9QQP2_ANGAN
MWGCTETMVVVSAGVVAGSGHVFFLLHVGNELLHFPFDRQVTSGSPFNVRSEDAHLKCRTCP